MVENFSGEVLVQSEPDASSFQAEGSGIHLKHEDILHGTFLLPYSL